MNLRPVRPPAEPLRPDPDRPPTTRHGWTIEPHLDADGRRYEFLKMPSGTPVCWLEVRE